MIHSGYKQLILYLLMQTKLDLQVQAVKKGQYYFRRQDALRFIQTEWFESLCLAVDLEPAFVRDRFVKGNETSREA